jgi:hypothetical protein
VQSADTVAEGINTINRLAGGVIWINIVHPHDGMRLQMAARAGKADAAAAITAMSAIGDAVSNLIQAVAVGRPPSCFTCRRPMMTYREASYCLITPHTDGPVPILTAVICPACARLPDLNACATAALTLIWPSARKIEISNAVGHA